MEAKTETHAKAGHPLRWQKQKQLSVTKSKPTKAQEYQERSIFHTSIL